MRVGCKRAAAAANRILHALVALDVIALVVAADMRLSIAFSDVVGQALELLRRRCEAHSHHPPANTR